MDPSCEAAFVNSDQITESVIHRNDFSRADRGIATVDLGIDAFAYEPNTTIAEAEVSTSRMSAIEVVIVWPVAIRISRKIASR